MPREYVLAEAFRPGSGQVAVSVGWASRPGTVQVATVRRGREQSPDPCDGIYVELDRGQVNALIRLLRRARNAAYGRDE
ncbi:MAG: hypothetical protein QN122_12025 [Armatimonadota bacterium]|nr:hypothetical protein [Armatimonadota bacterium]